MALTYTTGTPSDVRGCCGHKHKSVEAALACLDRDTAACRRRGGCGDRTLIVRSDGAWNTRTGIDVGDDWQGLVYCHGCGDEIASEDAHWHTGEPYCDGCESAPAEEL